jgi:hypothetical protein
MKRIPGGHACGAARVRGPGLALIATLLGACHPLSVTGPGPDPTGSGSWIAALYVQQGTPAHA